MELIVLLLLLGVFGLFISNRSLNERLRRIEGHLDTLPQRDFAPEEDIHDRRAAVEAAAAIAEADREAPPRQAPQAATPDVEWVLHAEPEPDEPEEKETLGNLFERLVAGKLLIWLGGIALVLSAIFLIRYSIEAGLMTPAQRMIGAAAFGLVLLGLGEYARKGRPFDQDPRFAQAFVGAGIAVLYATAYGSHVLYGLLGSGAASAAMLAITGAALALSLRHGAPTAVMGLIGGFLTPMLVGNPDAGAAPLLAYLALLDLAIFVIAWRRGWTWLAASAVALSFVWTAFLTTRPPDDALAAGLFVVLLSLVASLLRPGAGRELRLMQPLAIGIVELGVLVARTDLGFEAWLLFGALAAAAMALAVLRPGYRLAPPLALGLALVLLETKAVIGEDAIVPWAAAGITLLFGAGGLALALSRRRHLLWTAIAAVGAAAPFLIMRAARPPLLEPTAWGGVAILLAAVPAVLVWAQRRQAGMEGRGDPGLALAAAAAALLLGAACWDLLPMAWIGAGWMAIALGAALAARRLGDRALAGVAIAIVPIALLRCLFMLPDIMPAIAAASSGQPVLAADLPYALATLSSLAIPAALLAALAAMVPRLGPERFLRWIAALMGLAALYCWFKQAYGLDADDAVAREMLERTIVNQALFLAGWLLAAGRLRHERLDPAALRRVGAMLTALAAARLVWFDLLTVNPAWNGQSVGSLPVLNLVLPAYLGAAAWLYAARRRASAQWSGLWLGLFLAALVAGVALLVRQGFQGDFLTGPDASRAEFYGYSLAGIGVAIGLIVAGMRLPDKALRIAGLLLLTATIVKVFVIDASELKGLLRILSFLGLGIALIGIGRLYGPLLRTESRLATPREAA